MNPMRETVRDRDRRMKNRRIGGNDGMRDLLISICPAAIWCIVALETGIAVLLFLHAGRHREPVPFLGGILTAGLILDAAVIGLGSVLPESVLASVSPARFVAHGLLIPLILPICAYAMKLKKPVLIGVWILTGLLMIAGVAEAVATVLERQEFAGVVRYVSGGSTPAWASAVSSILSFGTVVPMMAAGIAVWIRRKNPHLFLAGFLMFVFAALGPATGNMDLLFFLSMFGELLMVLFLYFCSRRLSKERAAC